jgi:hypothetical protein
VNVADRVVHSHRHSKGGGVEINAAVHAVIDVNTGSPGEMIVGPATRQPSEGGAMPTNKKPDVTPEELDDETGEEIPDREAMSLIDANVAVPVNAAVAANVLTDRSSAGSNADQSGTIPQTNL